MDAVGPCQWIDAVRWIRDLAGFGWQAACHSPVGAPASTIAGAAAGGQGMDGSAAKHQRQYLGITGSPEHTAQGRYGGPHYGRYPPWMPPLTGGEGDRLARLPPPDRPTPPGGAGRAPRTAWHLAGLASHPHRILAAFQPFHLPWAGALLHTWGRPRLRTAWALACASCVRTSAIHMHSGSQTAHPHPTFLTPIHASYHGRPFLFMYSSGPLFYPRSCASPGLTPSLSLLPSPLSYIHPLPHSLSITVLETGFITAVASNAVNCQPLLLLV